MEGRPFTSPAAGPIRSGSGSSGSSGVNTWVACLRQRLPSESLIANPPIWVNEQRLSALLDRDNLQK